MGTQISGERRRVIVHLRSPKELSLMIWEVGVGFEGKSVDIRAHLGVCANLFCSLVIG